MIICSYLTVRRFDCLGMHEEGLLKFKKEDLAPLYQIYLKTQINNVNLWREI